MVKVCLSAFAAVLLVLVAAPSGLSDDDPVTPPVRKKGKLLPDPVVRTLTKEQAKPLLSDLDDAVGTKDVNKIVAALKKLVTARNEKFLKPIEKLTKHRRYASVRVMATRALGSQTPVKKVGPILFKILLDKAKVNKKSPQARAEAIAGLRRIRFDKPIVVKELESEFRKASKPRMMRECARYFGDLKKVGTVKMLIGWVEAPQPANPNSPTNPPAAYWQRMWEVWDEIKPATMYALKNITGREFETEREWRTWLDTREAKKLGIR